MKISKKELIKIIKEETSMTKIIDSMSTFEKEAIEFSKKNRLIQNLIYDVAVEAGKSNFGLANTINLIRGKFDKLVLEFTDKTRKRIIDGYTEGFYIRKGKIPSNGVLESNAMASGAVVGFNSNPPLKKEK